MYSKHIGLAFWLVFFSLCIYSFQFTEEELFVGEDGETIGKRVLLRREANLTSSVTNPEGKTCVDCPPECDITYCDKYSISLIYSYDPLACNTTFCYLVSSRSWNTPLQSFELLGATYNKSTFSSNISTWQFDNFRRLINIDIIPDGRSKVYCFTLPGSVAVYSSSALLHAANYSCEKDVGVPGLSVPCSENCKLDQNYGNANCNGCEADCANATKDCVTGSQTCTLRVLTPAAISGPPCNSIVTRACPTYCPVDCELGGPFWEPCPANCDTPVATRTGYYRPTRTSAFGGKPCPTLVSTTSTECSLSPKYLISNCPVDCVVDGIVSNPCPSACKSASSKSITVSYTYPITVSRSSYGGRPCPTETTTCYCEGCVLGSTPTSIEPCDAVCSVYDGRLACGHENLIYPIITPGPSNSICDTVKVRPCSKYCPCIYTASSCTDKCTVTSTNTDCRHWVGHGYQTWTATGTLSKCQTLQQLSCTKPISPIHCSVETECPSCDCTITNGPAFYNNATKTCTLRTVSLPAFGGNACPTVTPTFTCNNWCPGCDYASSECGCQYTFSYKNPAGSYVLSGTKTCERTLIPTTDCWVAGFPNADYSCKPKLRVDYPTSICSTTIDPSSCFYQLSDCIDVPCTYTSTDSMAQPWTKFGTKVCSATDMKSQSRPFCTKSSSVISCRNTINPIDITGTTACARCTPQCGPNDSDIKTASARCSYITHVSPRFGGKCFTSKDLYTTCYLKCTPTQTNSQTKLPRPTTNPFGDGAPFNAVIYGDFQNDGGKVGGRLAVAGAANLNSFKAGEMLSYPIQTCANEVPVLLIGGSLIYYGETYNGRIDVGGACDGKIATDCKRNCNLGFESIWDTLDFNSHFQYMIKMSRELSMRTPTASIIQSDSIDSFGINWSGTNEEVLQYLTSDILTSPNSFKGVLAPESVIIFNVYSLYPVFPVTFSSNAFLSFKSRLIWNFPKAVTITINASRFVGTIIAPNSTILTSGVIEGQVFALYLQNLEDMVYPELVNNLYSGYSFYS